MNQVIPIEQAVPGMMIVRVTAQNGPVKINKSGLISSPAMIQGLIEMGVQEIEYNPEQTVEICEQTPAALTEQTPTQALLRGQYDTRAQKADNAISEQFNRSLFLPTVNGLPGQWRRAVKPTMISLLLAVGGVATGYGLAIAPATVATMMAEPPSLPAVIVTEPTPPPADSQTDVTGTHANTPVSNTQTISGHDATPVITAQPSDLQNNPQNAASSAINKASDSSTNPVAEPATNTVYAPDNRDSERDNNPPVSAAGDENIAVSPDLMARFNKVLSDLEKEEKTGEAPGNNTAVTVHDDVQRVDQLPARLLTRLPTMDFSAHMYASAPRDRWVRVNGEDKGEGDWIADRVQIINIEAQRVILRFEGEVFAMTALTDW